MEKIPENLGAAYYRGTLSPQGREFYDRINARLLRGDVSGAAVFSVSDPGTAASDAFAAYRAVRDDHPEYFYLGYHSEFTRTDRTGTLKYPILYTPDIIARIRRQLSRTVGRLVRGTELLTLPEKEAAVYARIARKLAYTNNDDVRDHSIVGPVLLSSGVCEGHNALLLLCFRQIGIPCIKVYGKTGKDGGHCWTIAWINGTPVHCDVTWDGAREGVLSFNYLNLSDGQIGADHFDFRGPEIPVCPSEEYSYYHRHGLCVYSHKELRKKLSRDAREGRSPTLIHFGYSVPSGDYLKEVEKALREERIGGRHELYACPALHNAAVKTLS